MMAHPTAMLAAIGRRRKFEVRSKAAKSKFWNVIPRPSIHRPANGADIFTSH
jgi:hypothetical protein